jgi:tryptophan-rich sensory protein
MIITSVMLWKRKTLGYLFAVPLMVFAAIMGIGILSMFAVMGRRGLGGAGPQGIIMGVLVAVSLVLIVLFLRDV